MALHLDIAERHFNKHGEELCGDSFEIVHSDDSVVIVVSDGLGSGVKANILSSITAKMAATMLGQGLVLDEVIDALAGTLPVCEVRGLAYSTFSILQIFKDGRVYVAEYDGPDVYVGRHKNLRVITRQRREVGGKTIREAFFSIREGDWIVVITDGILHAGVGGVWNLGWGPERVGKFISSQMGTTADAQTVADEIIYTCNRLYASQPGDDGMCVVVKVRHERKLTMLVGPPVDKRDDEEVVRKLMAGEGRKVVCGGTTSNIVSRILDQPIDVDLDSMTDSIPPLGVIEGIDLVTEGMLTVSAATELLKAGVDMESLSSRNDAVSMLVSELLKADTIHVIIGRAINPAHQSPDIPVNLALKHKIVTELMGVLQDYGKTVTAEYY